MVLITSCSGLFEVNAFAPKASKHPKHTTVSARSQHKLSKTKMKFAWDMDKTLFSAISSIAPAKKHYSLNRDIFHEVKKTTRRIPFLNILAITSNKNAQGLFLRL